MSNFYSNKNSYAIAAGAIISIFLMQDPGAFFYTGILGAASLVLMALISPWMGLLALFPLAFALRPAPPSIGPQELAFLRYQCSIKTFRCPSTYRFRDS
jgi:hypothetical protein